ncbi:hypothetical protein PRIC1_011524 [Phytophthora ramorum]
MTLTELPEDVATLAQVPRVGRKRPRSDRSRLNTTFRPPVEDVPIPPIRVDKDLLLQVVRVKVQTLIRTAKLREKGLEPGRKHDPHCTAERLERLVPVLEQRWLQDLMNGDEPRYGFDDVVQAFQEIVHSDADDGQHKC